MTPTALPAPDIEIGLRHPVNCMLPRIMTGICDPVHNEREKLLQALLGDETTARYTGARLL
jgi:hypothetical protein